jgi:hypothetical protein
MYKKMAERPLLAAQPLDAGEMRLGGNGRLFVSAALLFVVVGWLYFFFVHFQRFAVAKWLKIKKK